MASACLHGFACHTQSRKIRGWQRREHQWQSGGCESEAWSTAPWAGVSSAPLRSKQHTCGKFAQSPGPSLPRDSLEGICQLLRQLRHAGNDTGVAAFRAKLYAAPSPDGLTGHMHQGPHALESGVKPLLGRGWSPFDCRPGVFVAASCVPGAGANLPTRFARGVAQRTCWHWALAGFALPGSGRDNHHYPGGKP